MRETSLNAIAITVFALTLSALLGPLLNVPPSVPAIAVFGILGLATLDTFQWQGQGSTILADWLAGHSATRRDRILHHEAGHFLVAYLLGIPVAGYALSAWEAFQQKQTSQGGVRFADTTLAEQLQTKTISSVLLDRYCTVWMAGIAAEVLRYGRAEGGAEDRAKIHLTLRQVQRPPSELKLKENWALLQARTLLENHQPAYQALVSAMEQRSSVAECYQIIEQNLQATD